MSVEEGVRVIRGPHWQHGDDDGGEGHLGTVKALLGNGMVRVLWDNGQEMTCKTGADGKYELRILDTAPVGVRHYGTQCAECNEQDIYGMLWRCVEPGCSDVTLCPLCYVKDSHDVKHVFERIDYEGAIGETMKKRISSLRIRAMGIFPGAKVKRGQDWAWGDQDGGPGSVGEVIGFENVAPSSSRNLVRVEWRGGGSNSYRLGLQGQVDLQCVEETSGTHYYRDHLPLVDTIKGRSVARSSIIKPSQKHMTSSTSASSSTKSPKPSTISPSSSFTEGAEGGGGGGGLDVGVGDKLAIVVDEGRLKELQANFGGATAGMIDCIGKTGELVSVTANGALQVRFKRLSYRLNPQVLIKVPELSVGDTVRIQADLNTAKVINRRVGWKPEMDVACGKVGKVVKIDEDGDVAVAFGRRVHLFSPACCSQAPGFEPDNLASSTGNSEHGTRRTSTTSEQGEQELHQKMMKMLAQMVQEGSSGGSDHSEMSQMFKAINRGDVEAVQNVCMADPSLMSKVHKGMTLLMVACHEAQRDIIHVLLDQGAPIDGQGEQGNTALGAALEGKREAIAILLLQRGASVNQLNSKGRSPAHVAAYNNLGDALKEIIRRGGDVNLKDNFGDCPLHDAIDKDNQEAIDALIHSPSLHLQQQNSKGFNMLQLACLRGNAYAVEKILKRDNTHINDLMQGEFNALQIAVTNDHVECARLLIVEGNAKLNIKGSQGLTALHLACNEAYPRSVELLVNYGADVSLKAEDGNTALHLAVGTKSTQLRQDPSEALEQSENRNRVIIARMLIENGARVDATNNNGAEPLQCCRYDDIRTEVKKFLDKNPQLSRRKSGSQGSSDTASNQQLRAAFSNLLRQTDEATKRDLQNKCQQS